jgi:NhaA family Na+:H+ antiporter
MNIKNKTKSGVYEAPWEKSFEKLLSPLEEFIHKQTTSGILLMLMAIVALFVANSFLAEDYKHLIHTPIALSVASWSIDMSLHHWINDGLMALFFFVVGLELKREILVGELASIKNAILPITAAIGGMVVPALIYLAINPTGEMSNGWGIPMATDIAFAIGALALLASRVPQALITFLIALAIVDDLGAVLVIALFYTENIAMTPLFVALGLFIVLIVLNLAGIRKTMPYFLVAVGLWYAMLLSGIHPTLAGILGAMSVPAIPKFNPKRFSKHISKVMKEFDASCEPGTNTLSNDKLDSVVDKLEHGVESVGVPLKRLEHAWHMPVAYIVIPIFALANAGIAIDFSTFSSTLSHPVTMGVIFGLIFGKFIGIAGVSWIMLKLGIAQLPKGTSFNQIAGVSLFAGIGFTMSIFVAQLGFSDNPELLLMAKTGILTASLLAGIAGFIWLYLASTPKKEIEAIKEESATE